MTVEKVYCYSMYATRAEKIIKSLTGHFQKKKNYLNESDFSIFINYIDNNVLYNTLLKK
jgi:hypothetical protein